MSVDIVRIVKGKYLLEVKSDGKPKLLAVVNLSALWLIKNTTQSLDEGGSNEVIESNK